MKFVALTYKVECGAPICRSSSLAPPCRIATNGTMAATNDKRAFNKTSLQIPRRTQSHKLHFSLSYEFLLGYGNSKSSWCILTSESYPGQGWPWTDRRIQMSSYHSIPTQSSLASKNALRRDLDVFGRIQPEICDIPLNIPLDIRW